MLRETANVDLHRLHGIKLGDAVLGEDVDHPRCEPAVGDYAHLRGACGVFEFLLLKHDLGVAAQVGEVSSAFDGEAGHLQIEVVRERAHGRIRFAHERPYCFLVAYVQRCGDEPGRCVPA
jgi:hypothetical protein